LTSPVNGPSSAEKQFCAPRATGLPLIVSPTRPRNGNGGQMITPTRSAGPATPSAPAPASSLAVCGEVNIFQLPATSFFRPPPVVDCNVDMIRSPAQARSVDRPTLSPLPVYENAQGRARHKALGPKL